MPSIFHNQAIELSLEVHKTSIRKYADAPSDLLRDAFFVLTHDAICVHRAIGALVDSGWPAPGAALFRTLMDMNVSALALVYSREPRLAAFKYLYSGLRRHSRDQALPAAARRQMFAQIRDRLRQLPDPLRQQAMDVVKERNRAYWFTPEWRNPSALIEQYGSKELRWVYMQMSAAAHGTFLGMRLYKENPDDVSINPEKSAGRRGLLLDFGACRFLLELARIRTAAEALGMEAKIDALIGEIVLAARSAPGFAAPLPNTIKKGSVKGT